MRSSNARPTSCFQPGIAAMYACTGPSPSPLAMRGLPPANRTGSFDAFSTITAPFESPPNVGADSTDDQRRTSRHAAGKRWMMDVGGRQEAWDGADVVARWFDEHVDVLHAYVARRVGR